MHLPSAFPACYVCYSLQTSAEVFEKDNCHACLMPISAVGLIYAHKPKQDRPKTA